MIELRWKPIRDAKDEVGVALIGLSPYAIKGLAVLQYRRLQGEEWSEWEDVPIGGGDG